MVLEGRIKLVQAAGMMAHSYKSQLPGSWNRGIASLKSLWTTHQALFQKQEQKQHREEKNNWGWRWISVVQHLASTRLWVQTPVLPKKGKGSSRKKAHRWEGRDTIPENMDSNMDLSNDISLYSSDLCSLHDLKPSVMLSPLHFLFSSYCPSAWDDLSTW